MQDFLDLQVWHKLAWVDPFYLDTDQRVRRLLDKQRGFDEADKASCASVELEILAARDSGIPRGRRARAGRALDVAVLPPDSAAACATPISISTTHPACRRAAAAVSASGGRRRTARAGAPVPSAAVRREPAGLWPSEGSVSDAVAELAAKAGFHMDGHRRGDSRHGRSAANSGATAAGGVEQPEPLYRPYSVQTGLAADCLPVPRSRACPT